jgi:hypothetical protein
MSDQEVLAEVLAGKLDALRPLVALFPGGEWRTTFKAEAARWRATGNGQPSSSDYGRECYAWAVAHEMFLDGRAM